MTEETRVLHRRRLDNGLVTYLAQIGGGIEIQGLEQDRVVIVRMFAKTSSFICWNYRMSRPVYSSSFFQSRNIQIIVLEPYPELKLKKNCIQKSTSNSIIQSAHKESLQGMWYSTQLLHIHALTIQNTQFCKFCSNILLLIPDHTDP